MSYTHVCYLINKVINVIVKSVLELRRKSTFSEEKAKRKRRECEAKRYSFAVRRRKCLFAPPQISQMHYRTSTVQASV